MLQSALIDFTLDGLDRCFMPDRGLWSFKRHLDGRHEPNETRPAYDVFYSLNVLLGLSRLVRSPWKRLNIDPEAMLRQASSCLDSPGALRYAFGTALWTAAALTVDVPASVAEDIRKITRDDKAIEGWTAQEIGMLLSGTVAQASSDPSWVPLAQRCKNHILANLWGQSHLFRDCAIGPRRHFASFASQVYCTLGLYHYGELFDDEETMRIADSCVTRLIALQGPYGEWPWFFHVDSGRVVDFYEVYSVHQHGMAPAILKLAMKRHVPGAKEALAKGFRWILGENEIGLTMVRPELSLIARSQARRGLSAGRAMRVARACLNGFARRSAMITRRPNGIIITPEVRSYELGWTLWSFGDDVDFPELTGHAAFRSA